MNDLVERATLARQSYGIACAQVTFGGPRGIWLECRSCPASDVIRGSAFEDSPFGGLTDAEAAAVFRRHGWTGDGERLLRAKCPKCSAREPDINPAGPRVDQCDPSPLSTPQFCEQSLTTSRRQSRRRSSAGKVRQCPSA